MQQITFGSASVEIARKKKTFQSSCAKKWSYPNYGVPPGNATSGLFSGKYSFHTNRENAPWWMVDLQSEFAIASVVIFNRQGFENRNKNMDILLSSDMMAWSTVYSNFKAFGGIYDENPLVCQLNGPKARFVRVQCRGYAVLHFDQLEVYAFP